MRTLMIVLCIAGWGFNGLSMAIGGITTLNAVNGIFHLFVTGFVLFVLWKTKD
ncbi:MAG: hypothetical protein IPL32_20360 [Chloracidobacterium sp.]|nr:hypothetical protein [Chloracidobacterium sp.]MBK8468175.1 hypothetical protein [Chloracidobacterium sp.]